ncbi:MAG: hypothetical protein ACR2P8_00985 [Myxococcota bacterium]
MRRFLRSAPGLVALLVLAGCLWVRLFAGGPVVAGVPGGWLRGELAQELPTDWSFANGEDYLLVESRAGVLPWSGRVWFLAFEGRLHLLLPAFFGDGLQQRLTRDPRVRVAMGSLLYPQVAVPVTSGTDLEVLAGPVLRRQFAIEVGGPVHLAPGASEDMALSIYRLEDPTEPGESPGS